jgi:hypothetical protein
MPMVYARSRTGCPVPCIWVVGDKEVLEDLRDAPVLVPRDGPMRPANLLTNLPAARCSPALAVTPQRSGAGFWPGSFAGSLA